MRSVNDQIQNWEISFEVRKYDAVQLPELVKIVKATFNVSLTYRLHDVINENLSTYVDLGSAILACYDDDKIVKVVIETTKGFRELPAMLHDAGIGFHTRRVSL